MAAPHQRYPAAELLVAEELADDVLLDAAAIVAAGIEELERQEEGEERPQNPVRVMDYAEVVVPLVER